MEDKAGSYAWESRITRALTQRIYLIPEESIGRETEFFFKVMGNTDNVYDVTITESEISCSCPDCSKYRNFCKHIIFVLIRVIGLQRGQLFEIELDAPTRVCTESCAHYFERVSRATEYLKNFEKEKRKPIEDDDECPICYESFFETQNEKTVWCKEGCGKSIHEACFNKWAKQKISATCVWCRAKWRK